MYKRQGRSPVCRGHGPCSPFCRVFSYLCLRFLFSLAAKMSDRDSAKFMNSSFLNDFIEAYRQYPCLWKVTSDEYRDRNKRDEALNNLLLMTRETIPGADIKFLKNRIESLKQSFRRELRKVKDSMKSGTSEKSVYKPRLWYYDILSFIADHEAHNTSTSPFQGEEEAVDEGIQHESQVRNSRDFFKFFTVY